ncbi:GAF domain-containing protein [bacterium]|nr:GAF domain-containing protein [bacterium]
MRSSDENSDVSIHTKRSFDRLSKLSDVSMALSSQIELEDLLQKICASVRHALFADEAYFLLLDSETFELVLKSYSGRSRKRPSHIRCPDRRTTMTSTIEFGFAPCHESGEEEPPVPLRGEALLARNAFVSRERLLFTRELLDQSFIDVPFTAAIILPLLTATQTLGLLIVANITSGAAFSVNDLEEATVYANLAAMAVEHRKLLKEREGRIGEMEKLNSLTKRFSMVQTLEGLIGLSFEYLAQIIPHDLGVVSLFNEDEETRYFISNQPLSPNHLENLTEHIREIGEKILGKPPKKVRSQQIFLPNRDGPLVKASFRRRIKSFLTVPLVVHGQNIGLVNLSAVKDGAFNREHLRSLSTLSSLLATAFENVKIRLYLERRLDELSVLFEISQSLTSTLVIDEVLNSIVSFSMEMMHALRCELRLLDPTGLYLQVRASQGLSKSFLSSTPLKVGEGILGNVIAQKRPISVLDVKKDPRTKHLKLVKRERLAGLLAVPILQRNKPIGVITVYTSKPRDFTQKEIDLLSTFAMQASIAIENARIYAKLKEQYLSMVMALAAAIETKDAYTHGHSKQVMEYAIKIAKELGLAEEEIETIKYAGLLHDIGKIGVNEMILSKTEKLTAEELEKIKEHPKYGAFIMEQVDFLKNIVPLTLHHHEKFDGTGYPLGLKGDEIPLGARVLAIADTFESMIADRPYRKAIPLDKVLLEMRKVAGSQLDPNLVSVFLEILKRENLETKKDG